MRAVEVQNVDFDPNRQRDEGQKRKREATLAFKYAWVMIKGTKKLELVVACSVLRRRA